MREIDSSWLSTSDILLAYGVSSSFNKVKKQFNSNALTHRITLFSTFTLNNF